jgi:hypothetical protein
LLWELSFPDDISMYRRSFDEDCPKRTGVATYDGGCSTKKRKKAIKNYVKSFRRN